MENKIIILKRIKIKEEKELERLLSFENLNSIDDFFIKRENIKARSWHRADDIESSYNNIKNIEKIIIKLETNITKLETNITKLEKI